MIKWLDPVDIHDQGSDFDLAFEAGYNFLRTILENIMSNPVKTSKTSSSDTAKPSAKAAPKSAAPRRTRKTGSAQTAKANKAGSSKSAAPRSKSTRTKPPTKSGTAKKVTPVENKQTISRPKKEQSKLPLASTEVSPEQRYLIIAEAAYYIAESHDFDSNRALLDWLEAEAQIDHMLVDLINSD